MQNSLDKLFKIFITFLWLCIYAWPENLYAQNDNNIRIIRGKKITLRADATHALSFIWFKNGEPIQGQHNAILITDKAGIYTVIALGDNCDSDISDPVKIITDDEAGEILVDIEIRNLPETAKIRTGDNFNYQLMVLNHSIYPAQYIIAEFILPRELTFIEAQAKEGSKVTYNPTTRIVTWEIDLLEAKSAIDQDITLKGNYHGETIILTTVKSKQKDPNLSNNQTKAFIDIIQFFIPNVFTPNYDGKNDRFVISGLEFFNRASLRIFNRFGNEVYRNDQYRNDWNGGNLTNGTYFYYLETEDFNGKKFINKGYVMIIRKM